MKKLFILLLSAGIAALMLTSCGTEDAPESSPSAAPSSEPTSTAYVTATMENAVSENAEAENAKASPSAERRENVPSNNEISSEEISIINGTSVDFYDLYLSANTSGSLGENIINGSVFGEGEELVLPYANIDTSQPLNLIVADESGRQYIIEDFPISNGAVIEIRLNGSTLEAYVQ